MNTKQTRKEYRSNTAFLPCACLPLNASSAWIEVNGNRIGIFLPLSARNAPYKQNLFEKRLETLHFPYIYWVVASSHLAVFCLVSSCFSSKFLGGRLLSGWWKRNHYWQLSVICNCQRDDSAWRLSPPYSLLVNLWGRIGNFFLLPMTLENVGSRKKELVSEVNVEAVRRIRPSRREILELN